ncbi:hypothetical protein C1I63_06475 [Rathayibacter caricis DSM 15933]|uniref:Uncharacterized protein n=1 Tax=Rathayibacter caricis DSM 15933 TaxID=1328867 RepID=A0A2T4USN3_9MICO|nr:hypothetical protein C1I63_06475 [Rathayibacter caricis DSM 15933]
MSMPERREEEEWADSEARSRGALVVEAGAGTGRTLLRVERTARPGRDQRGSPRAVSAEDQPSAVMVSVAE